MALEASQAFLDVLRSRSDGFDARILSGVEIKSARRGGIVCSIRVPTELTNAFGTLHGGAIATLVDCVSTMALVTMGASNTGFSIDLSVTYVSAARIGEEVEIESKVLKMGKNIAMLSAELRKGVELVASGHHTKYFSRLSSFQSRL